MPVSGMPSSGTLFHSLQATSQALHPMHTVVSVKKPIGSAITPSPRSCLLHVAHEGLPLVDRDVGIAYQGRELVAGITGDEPLVTPVKWHADVVDGAAGDRERTHPARHERLGADAATRARDRDPVGVADALLDGQLRADLDEKLRLKLCEPGVPAAHGA